MKVGKRSAVLRGVLRRERDGEIVSISEHAKSDVGGGGMAKL